VKRGLDNWRVVVDRARDAAQGVLRAVRLRRQRGSGSTRRATRVVVWERVGEGWRVLEGEVGGAAPVVLRAASVTGPEQGDSGDLTGAEGILVVHSDRFVCRTLDVPPASEQEIGQMLSLRLETELPYGVSEAEWAFRRLDDAAAGVPRALAFAVPAADVQEGERLLRACGRSVGAVEASVAALAQVAATAAPDACVVWVEDARAELAVVHGSAMLYGRSLRLRGGGRQDLARLAGEVEQSVQHCAFRLGRPAPREALVVGQPDQACGLVAALSERGMLSARLAGPPGGLEFGPEAGEPGRVFTEFAACVGALVAAHRRAVGAGAAAPALRSREERAEAPARGRLAVIAAVDAVLLAMVIGGAFGVRVSSLHAVTTALQKARSSLTGADRVEEEVKILQSERTRQRSVADLLLGLCEALPEGIAISDLNIDSKGSVTVQGRAPSVEAAAAGASALGAGGMFTDAKLWQVSQQKEGLVFRITCSVAGGGPSKR